MSFKNTPQFRATHGDTLSWAKSVGFTNSALTLTLQVRLSTTENTVSTEDLNLKSRNLSQAIHEFRKDCGQTQVEFAVALGVAATSIHRYEAGTSIPSAAVLKKLHMYAVERQNRRASITFFDELAQKIGVSMGEYHELAYGMVMDKFGDLGAKSRRWRVEGWAANAGEIRRATALVLLLRHGKEQTLKEMLDFVLRPWMERAETDIKKEYSESPRATTKKNS